MRTIRHALAIAAMAAGIATGPVHAAVVAIGGNTGRQSEDKLNLVGGYSEIAFGLTDGDTSFPDTYDCSFVGFWWESSCTLTLSGPVVSAQGFSVQASVSGTFRHKFPDAEAPGHEGETDPNQVSFSGTLKAGDIPPGSDSRSSVMFDGDDPHDASKNDHKDTIKIVLYGEKGPAAVGDEKPAYPWFDLIAVKYDASHPAHPVPLPSSAALLLGALSLGAVGLRRRR